MHGIARDSPVWLGMKIGSSAQDVNAAYFKGSGRAIGAEDAAVLLGFFFFFRNKGVNYGSMYPRFDMFENHEQILWELRRFTN